MRIKVYDSGRGGWWCFEAYLPNGVYVDSGFIFKTKAEAEQQLELLKCFTIIVGGSR